MNSLKIEKRRLAFEPSLQEQTLTKSLAVLQSQPGQLLVKCLRLQVPLHARDSTPGCLCFSNCRLVLEVQQRPWKRLVFTSQAYLTCPMINHPVRPDASDAKV